MILSAMDSVVDFPLASVTVRVIAPGPAASPAVNLPEILNFVSPAPGVDEVSATLPPAAVSA